MTAIQFLNHLYTLNISMWLEGEKLRFRAPAGSLTESIRTEITHNRTALTELLRQKQPVLEPKLLRVKHDGPSPLTFAQERLWFLDQLNPGVPEYNVYDAIEIRQPLNLLALRQAINELFRRHELLRTSFPNVDGVPVQQIASPYSISLPVRDISDLPEPERTAEAQRLASEEAKTPFDLGRGPPLRISLVKLGSARYLWLLSIHHIVSDDWSKKLLDQELDILYQAYSAGLPSPLPELPIQFSDFAVWQRQWLTGPVLESHLAYWSKQLEGQLPILHLPLDHPRKDLPEGKNGKFYFPAYLLTSLRNLCDAEGVTLYMVLLAGYAALLGRYTHQDDITIGTPISARNRVETERLIGFLLNTLPLRVRLNDTLSFRDLLLQVKEVCLGAYTYQTVPYERLMETLLVERIPGITPLFQTMLNLLNTPEVQKGTNALWGEKPVSVSHSFPSDVGKPGSYVSDTGNGTTKFDLSITFIEDAAGLWGRTEYNSQIFDEDTIAMLIERFQHLLISATADPSCRICDLDLMTKAQREDLLMNWSRGAVVTVETQYLHHYIESHASSRPHAIAVESNSESISYAQLNDSANRLAHHLRRRGVHSDSTIGIFMERSIPMFVAIIAVLKAGAICVPLDTTYPDAHLSFIIDDTHANILITLDAWATRLHRSECTILCLDRDKDQLVVESSLNLATTTTSANAAYILYTSGSAGRPKGVVLTHGALMNYAEDAADDYTVSSSDRILQFASIAFDASLEEIWVTFYRGATLVLRPGGMLDTTSGFMEHCGRLQLSILMLPTAYWHELVADIEICAFTSPLRCVVIGGERASPDKLSRWRDHVTSDIRLFNTYGPTEGTIAVTRCLLSSGGSTSSSTREVPIGRPIANSKVYLLDRLLQPVPRGFLGEIYIGGASLSRAYLNQPGLTAERFIDDPFSSTPGARLYKSGDVARFLPNRELEFRGRADAQVKIRGYRIEPREIEIVLEQHSAVKTAVVISRDGEEDDKILLAYVVLQEWEQTTSATLRTYLKMKLPPFMLPSRITIMPMLPLNANGKIDHRALPSTTRNNYTVAGYVAPEGDVEVALASIWAEVLKLNRVGRHDDFFDLGGHSLLAIRLVHRMRQVSVLFTLKDIFNHSTVAQLAAAATRSANPVQPSLPDHSSDSFDIPPSFARVHYIKCPMKEYDSSVFLQVPAGMEQGLLVQALQSLIDHHDVFRLSLLVDTQQQWRLLIRPRGSVSAADCLKHVDSRATPPAERLLLLAREYDAVKEWLDPEIDRLFRIIWLDAGPDEPAILGLVIHHLITDGVSRQIMIRDLKEAYEALARGEQPAQRSTGTSFRRWSELLNQEAYNPVRITEMPFWKSVLSRPNGLIQDVTMDGDTTEHAQYLSFSVPATTTGKLMGCVAPRFKVNIAEIALTALVLAADKWRHQNGLSAGALTVDVTGHGRQEIADDVDLSVTIGWLTTLYPVRLDLSAVDVNDLQDVFETIRGQLHAAPDRGVGFGLLHYLNTTTAPTLKALGRPQISFNYFGEAASKEPLNWKTIDLISGSSRARKVHYPLEHLLFISATIHEGDEGPELGIYIGWANRVLQERMVRSLSNMWIDALNQLSLSDVNAQTKS